jgi:hypothetical protein
MMRPIGENETKFSLLTALDGQTWLALPRANFIILPGQTVLCQALGWNVSLDS